MVVPRVKGSSAGARSVEENVEAKLQALLNEGRAAAVDWTSTEVDFPPYLDEKKFRLGQQAFYNNVFSMMLGKLTGLIALLAVPTILDIIVFTKQSGTPCTAFRRYVSTILHTFVWYEKKPEKSSEFLLSLKNVHMKHCIAFRRSAEAGLTKASQTDMALAQFGFIGFILVCSEKLGLTCTKEELEGFVHMWRVIGYMLGMEDKYNLCTGSVEEATELCRRLLDEVFLPSFATRSKNFDEMGRVLIEGLWPVNPHLDTKAFTAFTLHLAVTGATNNNHSLVIDTESMPRYSRFMYNLQLFALKYLIAPTYWWAPIFRAYFNTQMRIAIFLTEKFPFLAYYCFGYRESQVNIYKYYLH
ncbi:uncharacterized protein [Prorops nasuta]|uniref:uncharacterized protein n=1 Tax=Prorops nasuta TaxID=863751 RepID=UPI0034CF6542